MASEANEFHGFPVDASAQEEPGTQQYFQHEFDLNEPAPGGDIDEAFSFDLNNEPDEQQHQLGTQGATSNQPNGHAHHRPLRNRLNTEKRMHILMWLLSRSSNGKLQRGSIKAAVLEFNCSRKSISRIWNIAKQQRANNQYYNVSTQYHNSGRKRVQVPIDAITTLKMGDRSCLRDLASNLTISKSTCHRMVKRGDLKPHTNALHPGLTNVNMITRLEWILGLLQGDTPMNKNRYYGMFDFVHIDEKWFYLSKKSHRVYLAQSEKGQYRSAQSSKWIPKVMFTAAVARPRFNSDGVCTFDGKLGIFPFTFKQAAKRRSKHRSRGTMITKCIGKITQKVTRDVLINQIIPAIKEKWPQREGQKIIYIQQDNAKAHVLQSDPVWQQVYQQGDFTFILVQQPPKSPDLNILDLGFFRSIQSLMHKKMPKNIDRLLDAVHDAFFELQPRTLENVWMTLQYVMNEVLKVNGGNGYDLPHHAKNRCLAQGILELQVRSQTAYVLQAWNLVNGITQLEPQEDTQQPVQDTQEQQGVEDSEEDMHEA